MQSVSDIWSMVLTRLREDLSETTIKTWLMDEEQEEIMGAYYLYAKRLPR